jgi:hypothetical protein
MTWSDRPCLRPPTILERLDRCIRELEAIRAEVAQSAG